MVEKSNYSKVQKILYDSCNVFDEEDVDEEEMNYQSKNFTVTQNYQQIKHLKEWKKIVKEKNAQLIYDDVFLDDIEFTTKRRIVSSSYFSMDETFSKKFKPEMAKLRIGLNRKRPSNESEKWRNSIFRQKDV